MMAHDPLAILHITSDPGVTRVVQAHLRRAAVDCHVTLLSEDTDIREWLARGGFDLIFGDPDVSLADGTTAIALARQICPAVPVVAIIGADDSAVTERALTDGAVDCVALSQPWRLGPSVRRALDDVAQRARCRDAETAIAALQEQLRHSQKLETVGELAGGIAHDFNNLLTVINGYCERLLAAVDERTPHRVDVELIHKAGQRAAGLTRQLLAFSRRQPRDARPINVNDVVRDIERLLVRVIGERTTILTDLDPALGATLADPGQIEQVVMNLAINARDAMSEGGTITIETSNVTVTGNGHTSYDGLPEGRYVQLALRDTGHGMDAETAARIFEPFFTTKGPGKGTGLGLSTVRGIVTQSGGRVVADTRRGGGTTMRVFLPRVEAARPMLAPTQPAAAAARGHETVLLVEDEDFVRELVREFLEQAGYTVLEAVSAEDALRLVDEQQPQLDLLLTDVVLPALDGTALATRLAETLPHLATLYMSGYPGDAMFTNTTFEPGLAFLPKPFTRQTLLRKVREVLDAHHVRHTGARLASFP